MKGPAISIFPLDSIRNASVDHNLELLLEDVREEVAAFPFQQDTMAYRVEDVLEVYDLARPRLNVLTSSLLDLRGKAGADIGTGFGFLPVVLARCGISTVATEQDLEISHFAAARGVEIRRFHIGRAGPPFEPESLDFLVFAEVLEHLKLPAVSILQDLAVLLRPSGRLLLTTPNVARMQHIDALLAGENFLEPFPEDVPAGADATNFVEHVREYSVREVVDAVEAVGLGVERVLMTGWGESGYNPAPNPWVNEIIVLIATK